MDIWSFLDDSLNERYCFSSMPRPYHNDLDLNRSWRIMSNQPWRIFSYIIDNSGKATVCRAVRNVYLALNRLLEIFSLGHKAVWHLKSEIAGKRCTYEWKRFWIIVIVPKWKGIPCLILFHYSFHLSVGKSKVESLTFSQTVCLPFSAAVVLLFPPKDMLELWEFPAPAGWSRRISLCWLLPWWIVLSLLHSCGLF